VWDSVAIGGGGYVSAIIPSKTESGIIYARTDVGGAYRWDNAASKWIPLLDWTSDAETSYQGVEAIAVDPKNAAKMYMLAGITYFNNGKTVVLRSSDYGKTFSVTDVSSQFKANGNGMGRGNGERLVVDPGNSNILYAGTRWNGVFKSTDAGASWARLNALGVTTTPNDNGVSFVLPDPSSVVNGVAQRLFVGVSRYGSVGPNLYRSNDAGATFAAVSGSPSGLMPQRAAFDNAGVLYLTYANGAGPHSNNAVDSNTPATEPMSQGQIWKYAVTGGNWTNVTPSGVSVSFSGINVDPTNSQRLIASTINLFAAQGNSWGDRFYISTNGGSSWTDVVARGFAKNASGVPWVQNASIHWASSIVFDPFNPQAVWVTSGNGIFRTANIDAVPTTWTFTVKGLEETVPQNVISIPGGPLVSVVSDIDGFVHTNVTQYANTHAPSMGSSTGLASAAAVPSTMVRVGDSMYYTTNTGASWTKAPLMNGVKGQVALSPNGGVLLHSPENSSTTYRSVNFGSSWTPVNYLNILNVRTVADSANSSLFYAYDNTTGNFWTSYDGGINFYPITTLSAWGSTVIRTVPGQQGDIWVPLNSNGLARSTNSGTSFTKLASVTDCAAVGFGKAASGASFPTVYIWGTVNGVRGLHRSIDAGATWLRINDDAHEYGGPANGQFVVGDMNTFGVVYMSSAGRGILYAKPQ
jgi:hypothetical protein